MHGENTESPTDMGIDSNDGSSYRSDENLEVLTDPSLVSLVPFSENDLQSSQDTETCDSLMENSKLFYQKLSEFHQSSVLSHAVNVVGAVLDLHRLYKEVTMRGGFTRVTEDERWSEVASSLNFTSRSPKPSLQLQDVYANLIYQFEQIYFFGSYGKPATPPASVDPGTQVGNTVVGVIETKFDSGYLITVMIGSEKLNGLLYHIEDSAGKQFAIVPSLMDGVGLEDSDSQPVGLQVRVGSSTQGKIVGSSLKGEAKLDPIVGPSPKGVKKKDPEAPLGVRSAYQIFLGKECDRLKKIHGEGSSRNVRKMVIDKWKCLSENDRLPYIEESQKDKERFDRQMAAYKKRKIGKAEYTTNNSGESVHNFNNDYHVSLQTGETDELLIPDESMVDFAVELMENARQLNATMQFELDSDFFWVL